MKAKKSMGQNFLKSIPVAKAMISAGEVAVEDTILEIGPGKGMITRLLLATGAKIVAVEKDRELITTLEEKFSEEIKNKKLILINEDVLDFSEDKNKELGGKYKIVANIPYYITGAILKKFLTSKNQPQSITLLVQKEIADRIIARGPNSASRDGRGGKESILSLSVKAYGKPKYIKKVGKANFNPAPKVDSAIITIENISKDNFSNDEEEKLFFEIVKSGFSHKRKKLISNLTQINKLKARRCFEIIGLDEKVRAEDLDLENWIELVRCIKTTKYDTMSNEI